MEGVFDHWVHIREVDASSPFAPTHMVSTIIVETFSFGARYITCVASRHCSEVIEEVDFSRSLLCLHQFDVLWVVDEVTSRIVKWFQQRVDPPEITGFHVFMHSRVIETGQDDLFGLDLCQEG